MFKSIFKALGKVLTWLSPLRQTTQAALLRAIATDLVRSWFQKNPGAVVIADEAVQWLTLVLSDVGGVSRETAERVIRSAILVNTKPESEK